MAFETLMSRQTTHETQTLTRYFGPTLQSSLTPSKALEKLFLSLDTGI